MIDKSKNRLKNILRVLPEDCDIFGETVDDTIAFLNDLRSKHPDKVIYIDDHWTGYEDVEYRFIYYSDETEEEYTDRQEVLRRLQEKEDKEKSDQERRKSDLNEYNRLKKKLGL